MLTVHVLLFASYADALGTTSINVDVSPGARVRDVLSVIQSRPGAERLPPAPLVAINSEYANLDDAVAAHDELAIIPPVAGG